MNRNDTHSLKEALSALADNEPGGNEGTTESEPVSYTHLTLPTNREV